MHSVFTNIFACKGNFKEVAAFNHGVVIGCYIIATCQSISSSFLDISQPAIRCNIAKWKRLETTALQPQAILERDYLSYTSACAILN